MTTFTNHTIDSAPAAARAILEGSQKSLGFVPNLYAKLAESPTALNAYTTIGGIFEKSSLSPAEQQVVLLTTSVVNGCEFCVAAHSLIARQMVGVDDAVVDAIRARTKIPETKLEALATFTRQTVEERGWVSGEPVETFISAGFSREQALDVIVGVAVKTLSNYANHLTSTKTNPEFAAEAWSR